MTVHLSVMLFGPARDAMDGSPSISLSLDELPISILKLREGVTLQFPALRFVLLNAVFAYDNKLIPQSKEESEIISDPAREIVLVPPVSGG